VYLLHPIALMFPSHYFGYLPRYARVPFVAGAMLAVLPFSWAVYYLIDRPVDRARKAWVKSRRSSIDQPLQAAAAALAAA
jgi:peptidoglycan/LPS O-acetylase OafA/YrhL